MGGGATVLLLSRGVGGWVGGCQCPTYLRSSLRSHPTPAPVHLPAGLVIEFADPHTGAHRTATFLPEVAAHEGWDKQQVSFVGWPRVVA